MNRCTIPTKLTTCIFALLCLASVGWASPQPSAEDNVHFCQVLDYEDMRARDSLYAARKQALNLNVGEPRTVRMIYFLPSDRPFRQEVVDSMKTTIRQIQTFFRDQMRANGYGGMTFRFETDAGGNPMVHRVDGQYSDSHYLDHTSNTVLDEVGQAFDLSANVYLIVVDNSINTIGTSDGRQAGGVGYGGRNSGFALVPGGFNFFTAAHELGHAFGLWHDFNSSEYIMSYGGRTRDLLSACHAEFLSVHPYFNPSIPDGDTPPPTIELISSPLYPAGSKNVSVQLRVSDPDGLHQVTLFVSTREPHFAAGSLEVKACRGLNGEREAVVQFDYDGVIPSSSDPHGTGTSLSNPPVHNLYIYAVDTGGNVSSGRDGYFPLWNTENERNVIATLEGHSSDVSSVSFSPDGRILASASYDSTVKLWDVATRRNIATLEGHTGWVESVSFSPNGSTLASGSWDGTVKLWDVATRQNFATLEGHRHWVNLVAFSPDGSTLASAAAKTIKLWDVSTRQNFATLTGPNRVFSVSFSPDSNTLASASYDNTVKLWDVATRQNIATLEGHWHWVNSVSFSPDGSTLASGSSDRTVKLWDVATRQNIATLEGHKYGVRLVSFSPDGRTLASGSWDKTIKLWDVATRRNIETLYSRGEITSLAFSPDGKILAPGSKKTSNDNGQVVLWDMQAILPSQPQALVKISGDNQQGVSGEALMNPFVVEVRDKNGVGLAGFPVRFTVTAGDGKLSGRFSVENATTDANGRAQSTLTLGDLPGTNTVEASFAGRKVAFNAVGVGMPTPPIGSDYQTWHLPEGAIARLGKGRINEVAFSPDGSLLAVASSIGIWLYDAATSRELALLLGHTSEVTSVSFSPDGSTLASGSADGTVKLWDVATRRNIATLRGHRNNVTSVSFSPDGSTLASGARYGTVKLWDVATRRNIATLEAHTSTRGGVLSVSFSPDGSTLASGSHDDTVVKLWDVATRRNIATLEGHRNNVTSVSFSPDGSTLASGARYGTVKLWDVATRRNIATLEGHRNNVTSVSFSPDGSTLASGSHDDTVKLWDMATRQNIATLEGHTSEVLSVSFSPDGSTLASGSWDNTVKLWDVATKSWNFFTHTGVAEKVSFSPDGSTLASGSRNGRVKLWDVATRRNIATLEGHSLWVTSVSFSPDGSTLASGSRDNTVKLWDVATRQNIATLEAHTSWINSVSFSPDGSTLASGARYGRVKLWDVATRQNIATLEAHTSWINSVSFSPDGSTLASGSHREVKLWDMATRQNIATLTGHTNDVFSVSFSPDGSTLASGASDRTVKLWDVATRRNIATLTGHTNDVFSVSFSPDGSTLASGLRNGRVKLWDVATRRNIATLEGHGNSVGSVSFSPDGSTLASGSWDGTVLLWDMSPYITPLTSFSLSLDGDGAAGDQAVTTLEVSPGPVATIQVFGRGIRQADGISARFEYDSAQVAYEDFDAGGVLPNAQVLAVPSTNPTAVEINLVSFGGQATADRGMVGTIRFRKMSAFSGTTLRLVRAELGRGTQRERVTFVDTHITLQPAAAALTPDFNGDGRVDSADFVLFTAQFGLRQGDPGYDAWYDLDGDGTIGFGDFLIFGRAFGREGS